MVIVKKVNWVQTDIDIFETSTEIDGIIYKICVESNCEKWIYTITSEDMDLPLCSIGSYDTKEEAQESALEEFNNV